MSEYIEREAAIEYLTLNMGWNDEDGYPVDDWDERKAHIADLINGIPAADVRPVVRGEWLPIIEANEYGETYQTGCICSECNEVLQHEPNFCPNCGADMREES